MPTRKLALERGGERRLQLRWRWGMRELEVSSSGQAWKLDGAAAREGAHLTLPGGSTLLVQRVRRRWWSVALRDDLRVELDGVPVPGSDGDPRVIGRRAASVIALFGLLRLLLVFLWIVFGTGGRVPGGGPFALEGLALILLAALAAFGLRTPVILGAGVLALELVVSVVAAGGRASPVGVIVSVLVIVHLYGGWTRMRPPSATPTLGAIFE